MAKTIKFNLVLDGYPVRTIEELQEHFSIEDILNYYKNGLLKRWLDARGYDKYSTYVSAMMPNLSDNSLIKELAKIFEIKISPKDMDKATAILDYLEQQKTREAQYIKIAKNTQKIINDYFNNYNALIHHIEENCDKIGILRAAAIEIEREYFRLFIVNHRALFYRLKETAPKMIYVLLTREALQTYLIGHEADSGVMEKIETDFSSTEVIKRILGDDAIWVRQDTQGNWDPVEAKNRKVMMLYVNLNSFVRNSDNRGEKLSQSDIIGKFRLLSGIDLQSSSSGSLMIYMEV